jgi:hypothetical protein
MAMKSPTVAPPFSPLSLFCLSLLCNYVEGFSLTSHQQNHVVNRENSYLLSLTRPQRVRLHASPQENAYLLSLTRTKPQRVRLHASSQDSNGDFASLKTEALTSVPNDDFASLEREVITSVQAQLDRKRVVQAFLEDEPYDPLQNQSSWQVPFAAAVVASTLSFVLVHNPYVTGLVLAAVFIAASGDPVEEESIAGAMARILGRSTLQSVQASQPKVRAVARAFVTGGEEIVELKRCLRQLENENEQLRLWKARRMRVDEALPNYSLDQLKDLARENGVSVGGTKSQLLFRLVEEDTVDLL